MNFKNRKVLCVGEVLWDKLPAGAKPGGAPMNVAIHMKRLGIDVHLSSRVGKDEAGAKLVDFMASKGLDVQLIQTDDVLPTSEVLVHLDKQNNASYEICEPVAWDALEMNEQLKMQADQAGIILTGTLASRNKTSRETIAKLLNANALKFVDVNLRPPFDKREIVEMILKRADVLKINDDELEAIASWHNKSHLNQNELMLWLAGFYQCAMIVLTRGAKGAVVLENGVFYEHPGFKVKAVDTVGAGDAFLAGFVSSLLLGKSTEEAVVFACATGAYVATQEGGTPEYSLSDIEAFL